MKKLLLAAVLLLSLSTAQSQILKPVTWSYAYKKINAKEAIVYVKATISNGWHVYSQNIKEGGPVKTTFTFAKSPTYAVLGKTIEPKPISKFEETFGMDVSYFEKTALFSQKVRLTGKKALVKGTVEFMTCDDKQCLPPEEVNFSVAVK
jgi:hypothetical protein